MYGCLTRVLWLCRTQISELVRFKSSRSGEGETSLKDYVSRMQDKQQGIFYIAADTVTAAESSPFVEKLHSRGFEVSAGWPVLAASYDSCHPS